MPRASRHKPAAFSGELASSARLSSARCRSAMTRKPRCDQFFLGRGSDAVDEADRLCRPA